MLSVLFHVGFVSGSLTSLCSQDQDKLDLSWGQDDSESDDSESDDSESDDSESVDPSSTSSNGGHAVSDISDPCSHEEREAYTQSDVPQTPPRRPSGRKTMVLSSKRHKDHSQFPSGKVDPFSTSQHTCRNDKRKRQQRIKDILDCVERLNVQAQSLRSKSANAPYFDALQEGMQLMYGGLSLGIAVRTKSRFFVQCGIDFAMLYGKNFFNDSPFKVNDPWNFKASISVSVGYKLSTYICPYIIFGYKIYESQKIFPFPLSIKTAEGETSYPIEIFTSFIGAGMYYGIFEFTCLLYFAEKHPSNDGLINSNYTEINMKLAYNLT